MQFGKSKVGWGVVIATDESGLVVGFITVIATNAPTAHQWRSVSKNFTGSANYNNILKIANILFVAIEREFFLYFYFNIYIITTIAININEIQGVSAISLYNNEIK